MEFSRNPFLFRGPIPTSGGVIEATAQAGRNPFLFRGPIPTKEANELTLEDLVAIPSYSEVLFLLKRLMN